MHYNSTYTTSTTDLSLIFPVKHSLPRNGQQGLEFSQYQIYVAREKKPIQLLRTVLLFVRVADLHVNVWFCIVERLSLEVLRGTPFIDRFITEIFPGEKRVVPWHSGPVSILKRQLVKSEQPVLHLIPSNIVSVPYRAIIRIAKQVILQSYTRTWLNSTTPVSGLFLLVPAQLTRYYSHLQVAPEIINTSKDCTFGLLISNFISTMQLVPKRMVVTYTVAAPAVIVASAYKQASRNQQKDSNLASLTSTTASVHHRQTKKRKVQMTRHRIVESKHSLRLDQDWQEEINISEAYIEYFSKFVDMFTEFFSM